MSESGDYSSSSWSGHDFRDAYKRYDRHAGRSYADAQEKGTTVNDLVPEELVTQSEAPLVLRVDHTGSMLESPKKIFEKLPYFSHEVRTVYLGEGAEVSVGAVGDAASDQFPLQAQPFTALIPPEGIRPQDAWEDPEITKRLLALVLEGHGGGSREESYELAALYDARHIVMPNAKRAIWICVGDESPYPKVDAAQARAYCRVDLKKSLTTAAVFAELQKKFAVYFIQLPYYGRTNGEGLAGMTLETAAVRTVWVGLLGEDHVPYLEDPARVVDVIFGILAKETGREAYFAEELAERQMKDEGGEQKIATVHRALDTIHRTGTDGEKPEHSRLHRPKGGTRGKGLL
ncbi:hypothetical protein HY480_01395 [Candidatus Uhrbacteria bacterium]|nr:hypothetical protein [Candidatus Uhrbacteria bacterium]